jgi:hypothetical protein
VNSPSLVFFYVKPGTHFAKTIIIKGKKFLAEKGESERRRHEAQFRVTFSAMGRPLRLEGYHGASRKAFESPFPCRLQAAANREAYGVAQRHRRAAHGARATSTRRRCAARPDERLVPRPRARAPSCADPPSSCGPPPEGPGEAGTVTPPREPAGGASVHSQ